MLRSRTMELSAIATRPPSWGAMGRSTGFAYRALMPRPSSPPCLGESNGRWLIAPIAPATNSRSYRGETGILETSFETDSGSATIIDFMPVPEADGQIELIRLIRGNTGRVPMHTEIILRFDYGRSIPWVRRRFGGLNAISGPHAVQLSSPVPLRGTPELTTIGEFEVAAGEIIPFSMSWYPSHRRSFASRDPVDALQSTENWWHDWTATCALGGPWREAIIRSLITLKMLTYEPTGGIVAAPTTSLPEFIGGGRNWDYRYCWLRDATLACTR